MWHESSVSGISMADAVLARRLELASCGKGARRKENAAQRTDEHETANTSPPKGTPFHALHIGTETAGLTARGETICSERAERILSASLSRPARVSRRPNPPARLASAIPSASTQRVLAGFGPCLRALQIPHARLIGWCFSSRRKEDASCLTITPTVIRPVRAIVPDTPTMPTPDRAVGGFGWPSCWSPSLRLSAWALPAADQRHPLMGQPSKLRPQRPTPLRHRPFRPTKPFFGRTLGGGHWSAAFFVSASFRNSLTTKEISPC